MQWGTDKRRHPMWMFVHGPWTQRCLQILWIFESFFILISYHIIAPQLIDAGFYWCLNHFPYLVTSERLCHCKVLFLYSILFFQPFVFGFSTTYFFPVPTFLRCLALFYTISMFSCEYNLCLLLVCSIQIFPQHANLLKLWRYIFRMKTRN